MRTRSLFLLVVVVAAAAVAVAVVAYPVGATSAGEYWYPIGDIDNPHVQELGEWSVEEHVRLAHDGGLKFRKVTSGEEEGETGGIRYHLIIDALSVDGKLGRYDAELIEDVRANTRRLISFVLAN